MRALSGLQALHCIHAAQPPGRGSCAAASCAAAAACFSSDAGLCAAAARAKVGHECEQARHLGALAGGLRAGAAQVDGHLIGTGRASSSGGMLTAHLIAHAAAHAWPHTWSPLEAAGHP